MKTILRAYKYRLYPNKTQQEYFSNCFGCVRRIYNLMLSDRIDYYKQTGKSLKNKYSDYLEEYSFLRNVDSQALAQAYVDLNTAYSNFFKRPEVGFPKFKSKKVDKDSYRNCMPPKAMIQGNYVKIAKIGLVKFVYHRAIPENAIIKSYTVSRTKTNKYFISILVQEEYEPIESTGAIIGFDLGIKDFLITSDGQKFENIKTTNKYAKKLKRAQQRFAKTQKESKNHEKRRLQVAKVHEKIANIRNDYLHKISHQLIDENQVIISENLKVSNMVKNHNLAKAIEDCAWSTFTTQLTYKSEWNDRQYIKIDTFFPSSKLCHCCGFKYKDLTLDIREWDCPQCNEHHDRDINAAMNILAEGLKLLNQ